MANIKTNQWVKIGEVARQAGVLASTVRYYTDLGLLETVGETPGGQHLYDVGETLARIARIRWLEQRGMDLQEIKAEFNPQRRLVRVLVVDDEPTVGELMGAVLQGRVATELRVARDGFSAGEMLAEYLPDLVVLDLRLPGIDGIELCRRMRRTPRFQATKILAITGYDTPETRTEILAAGADGYLPKPFTLTELGQQLETLLKPPAPPQGGTPAKVRGTP
ncbi:MAG: response regulator [Elusimicrobia bacterium]|nr:response regulator [Elusimicrobiota bacterium]